MKSSRTRRKSNRNRHSLMEKLEARMLLASDWQNPARPLDVNNDGQVSSMDALRVINKIATSDGAGSLGSRSNRLQSFYDTSGDGKLTTVDALRVINGLGQSGDGSIAHLGPEAEGDVAPAGFTSVMLMTLPGDDDQRVDLSAHFEFVREEFNELGFFIADDASGTVSGLPPEHADYPQAVFASAHRGVAYSKFRAEPFSESNTFPAGRHLGVYVLQPADDLGDSDQHLRLLTESSAIDVSSPQIGWEMHASHLPGMMVGNRGFDDVIIDVQTQAPYDSCTLFVDDLTGWRTSQSGGSDTGRGSVVADECTAVLSEGDSFVTTLETTFVVPAGASELSFTYSDLEFDRADTQFINDAFEVALVDRFGNPLVAPYTATRDAFYNVTEELGAVAGSGVSTEPVDGGTKVTVDLSGVIAGETASLIFRLANDDTDTTTTVRIIDYVIPGYTGDPVDVPPDSASVAEFESQRSRTAPAPLAIVDTTVSADAQKPPLVSTPIDYPKTFVYTTADDFQAGELFNLHADQAAGSIQLNASGGIEILPIIWISNSGDGTVSKFNTETGEELGRYRTGANSATNPSRIAVTGDGAAWVANRGDNTSIPYNAVKILHDGFIDRNGNGVVDTSFDANGDGRISGDEMLPWDANGDGQPDDERIAMTIHAGRNRSNPDQWNYGGGARGIAIDGNGKLWVGLLNRNQYEVFDEATGAFEKIVAVSGSPYGSVIDSNGILYSTTANSRQLDRIDTHTQSYLGSIDIGQTMYGITLDENGVVWTSGWQGSYLTRYDPATGEIDHYNSATGESSGGGVAVDHNGDVWAAHYDGTYLFKWEFADDRRTLLQAKTVETGANGLKGAAVDADGFFWTTSLGSNTAIKVDPDTDQVALSVPTGNSPYNYSDSTGSVRANLLREGTWTETIDSGRSGTVWTTTRAIADTPEGSALTIRVRASDDPGSIESLPWTTTESLATLQDVRGQFLEVQLTLQSSDPAVDPSVIEFAVDALAPPDITILTPSADASIEPSTIVLSGIATAATPFLNVDQQFANSIAFVTVNGKPVDALDAGGTFYAHVDVATGLNAYDVEAFDAYGQSRTVTVSITGREPSGIELDRYSDITGSFSGVYGRTSFNEDQRHLYVDLATRNDGVFESEVPLLVGVRNISDPAVSVVDPDGYLDDGTPYFDFSDAVDDGTLEPNEVTASPTIAFGNPLKHQFDYELVFLGKLNEPPVITTIPATEAPYDRTYRYDVDAIDADGDALTYTLTTAPEEMGIDSATGLITWMPSQDDIGQHDVAVRVSDGNGGVATQHYTVTVSQAPPNRPPVITSTPVTIAELGENPGINVDLQENDKFFLLGGVSGQTVSTQFDWTIRQAAFNNEFGVYRIDDAQGTVDGLLPGDPGYGAAALAADNSLVVFRSGLGAGAVSTVDLQTGQLYAAYIIQNGTTQQYRDGNRAAFFSYEQAHGGVDRLRATILSNGKTQFAWEDATDFDFTDVVYTITTDSLQLGLNDPYQYDVQAIDPDLDTLTYALVESPDGMRIDSTNGLIRWNPSADQIGNHDVTVEVSDGNGGVAVQEFVVCVHPDPENHPPTIVSDPNTSYGIAGVNNPASGNISPTQLSVPLEIGGTVQSNISLTLPDSGGDLGTADIVFVVDESGSMAGEQAWLGDIIASLDQSLVGAGLTNNRYGLVGFANTARVRQSGSDRWMSATDFATATNSLSTSRSGAEDGYDGIEYTLNNYSFRDEASRVVILVTDEERTTVNGSVSFNSIADRLENESILFSIVANARMEDSNDALAFGVAADGTAYVSDGGSGFTASDGGQYVRSEPVGRGDVANIRTEYVDLAWGVDGITWDLNFLRSDAAAAEAFTNVFSDVLGESIIRNIPINVVASDPDVGFVNLTGIQTDIATGQTVSFDIQFESGTPSRFDLAFVNANTNEVLGSIPVNLGDVYEYQVVAVDPDNDELTYRLPVAPDGMAVDSAGRITWTPSVDQSGVVDVKVAVSDGRGGMDAQSFQIQLAEPGTASIAGNVTSEPYAFTGITIGDVDGFGFDDPSALLSAQNTPVDIDGNGLLQDGEFLPDLNGNLDVATGSGDEFDNRDLAELSGASIGGFGFVDRGSSGSQWTDIALSTSDQGTNFPDPSGPEIPNEPNFEFRFEVPKDSVAEGTELFVNVVFGDYDVVPASIEVIANDGSGAAGETISIPLSIQPANENGLIQSTSASLNFDQVFNDLGTAWNGYLDVRFVASQEPYTAFDYVELGLESITQQPDPSEVSLPGWIVFIDSNDNMVLDPGERFTETDSEGHFEFQNLAGGDYSVRQVVQQGWSPSFPVDNGYTIRLNPGQSATNVSFVNSDVSGGENQRPVITGSAMTETTLGDLYRYDVVATDHENDGLEFRLPLAPDGMTIHPDLGSIAWLPTEDQLGGHNVVMQVSDGRGGLAVQSFQVVVTAPNVAPTITSAPAVMAIAGNSFTHRLRAQDADGDQVTWRLSDTAPDGITISRVELMNSDDQLVDAYHELVWDVPESSAGSEVSFSIIAEDGRGGSDSQDWTLDIADASAVNRIPVIHSSPRPTARFGLDWTYDLQASDPDGDTLTYQLIDPPTGMQITDGGILRWTPSPTAASSNAIEIQVSDGRGGVATQSFDLSVASVDINQLPEIISVPPTHWVSGRDYRYDAVARDPDGDPVSWELTVAPRGMSIDPYTGVVRWTPDESQIGSHFVEVTATDVLVGQATQRFGIDVGCNNVAPAIVSIPPTVGYSDRVYLYAVRGDDLENDPLTWKLLEAPDGMEINETTGLIRWTPTAAQVDSHDVLVEVSDGLDTGTQAYTIVVKSSDELLVPGDPSKGTVGNRAPIITSTPIFAAEAGTLYTYQVRGVDPDGDAVTFSIAGDLPATLTIDDAGLITWTPAEQDPSPTVIVTATDDHGATSTQTYLLSVAVNSAPQINSTPIDSVVRGATYRYTVRASDPEGDPLTYRLNDDAPDGMTIDRFGRIIWQTDGFSEDAADVTVTVADNRGQSASDTWQITLLDDTIPPQVSFTIISGDRTFQGDGQVDQGSSYTVRVLASDNVGVVDVGLIVDGAMVTLDDTGAVVLTGQTAGAVALEAFASDTAGLRGESDGTVTIVDPSRPNQPVDPNNPNDPGTVIPPDLPPHPGFDPTDNQPPEVVITSPEVGENVMGLVTIEGTVDDPEDNLWYYRVFYARADKVSLTGINLSDPDWVMINEGTEEVHAGQLAVFDSSAVSKDGYAIVVAAYDVNGRGYVQPTLVNVEGNLQLGNFRLEFTDLSIPLVGIPINVTRVYDTLNAGDEGDFGYGWSLGVQDARIFEAGAVGTGGALSFGNDKFVAGKTKVYLTNPDGQRVGFTYDVTDIRGSFFGSTGRPVFTPDPGVYDTLTIDQKTVAVGGIVGALAGGINPDTYTLTTKEGLKYRYNQFDGLQTITDLNGNTVTFSDDGISHSSGASVKFVRDAKGRITEVVQPSGDKVVYQYDVGGDLRSLTDLAGLTTSYTYRDHPAHYLDQGFDPQGDAVLTVVYEQHPDSRQWEFKGVVDATGNRIDDRDVDVASNSALVRDANGNPTKLTYDDRGNVVEEKDPLGAVTYREYGDPHNPDLETRIIDRLGFVSEREYDNRGNILRVIELGTESEPFAEPVLTTFTYDSGNRVNSVQDASGATTAFSYDARGNLMRIVNAEGNSSAFTYDGRGRRTTFTDFNGNTTTFDYTAACPCGSPSRITYADGSYETFRYNRFGLVTREASYEADGTLVEQMETKYDSAGRVTEETTGVAGDPNHPPTIVRKFYDDQLLDWEIIVSPESIDANGNLTESPATPIDDRFSRITDYGYDQNDRLIRQTDAEGGVVQYRYDAQGNRVLLQDPVGNITTWVYDELNRVVEERDPFYWVDLVGADASLQSLSNDELLEQIAPVDPVSPANPSDPRDPLYDDPSGADCHTNTAADHVRLTCYDAEGNQSKTIDRNARRREFEYDHAGRLVEERWYNAPDHATDPNASVETIQFTYDVLGNMLTASDSNSRYLHTYDELNRLTSVDNNPIGDRDVPRVILNYEYDAQGNLTKTYDDAGVTVKSEYDSRNRLWIREWYDADVPVGETPDVDPARVDFFYNAAGREKEVRRYSDLDANTLIGRTERTYDTAGRSDELIHRNAVDELLAGYDYDYDFGGLLTAEERTHQDPQYAQSITYGYDLTGQLTDAIFSGQADEHYTYDANGNRLTSRVGEPGNYVEQTYSPAGPANQLRSDGVYEYFYDGEGNQIKRVHRTTGETRTFHYDHHNRLVRVDDWSSDPGELQNPTSGAILTQSVRYTYDVHGRKIADHADGDGENAGVAEQTFFVLSDSNVWTDLRQTGERIGTYLFRDEMDQNLARYRSGEGTSWYLADHLRSIRDINGAGIGSQNRSEFGVFGSLLTRTNPDIADRYNFTGRELDFSTNDYFFRARFMSPLTGRFLQQDPLGIDSEDVNFYRYALNAPTFATDATGLTTIIEYKITLGNRTFGIALHGGHHYWTVLGRQLWCIHLQFLFHTHGVGAARIQIPLPWCRGTRFPRF
ncbi:putative Ig domain-containing protein [Rhodopirellula sp. JC639]|uniref:putative Ig domain-containing protein n=1 Tax=Stieleria mannarensis TaxID=2755585 RepID=UPI001600CB3B|nr:putative Ig domain-containing protein [Rhodopirellula sp. JC639]